MPKKSENIGEQEVEVKVVEATAVEVKVKAAPRCCSGHTEARFSMWESLAFSCDLIVAAITWMFYLKVFLH